VEGKPAEMGQLVRWDGRLKEQGGADVDMECGLCAARRPVTVFCGVNNELKSP
jgi:hypothetical protein